MWLLKCDQNSVIKFEVRFSGSPASWQVRSSHAWPVAAVLDSAEPRHSPLLQKGLSVELVPTETECYQRRNIIWNIIWALKKNLFGITRSSRDIKIPNSFLMHIIEKQLRVNGC